MSEAGIIKSDWGFGGEIKRFYLEITGSIINENNEGITFVGDLIELQRREEMRGKENNIVCVGCYVTFG